MLLNLFSLVEMLEPGKGFGGRGGNVYFRSLRTAKSFLCAFAETRGSG
jgi:hypothetical protein